MSVLDLATGTVTTRVKVGEEPEGDGAARWPRGVRELRRRRGRGDRHHQSEVVGRI
jgi:hypothetical protein